MKVSYTLLLLLLLLTVARYAVAMCDGVTAEEAYYWMLGAHWEWASFEGPGGLTALVAGLNALLGPKVEVLRALGPLWVLVGTAGLWWWGRMIAGKEVALWGITLWNILPVVNQEASFFSPSLLFVACWIWVLTLSWKAAFSEKSNSIWWCLAGGVAACGGLVSYSMLLAPMGVLLFLILELPIWHKIFRISPRLKTSPDELPKLRPGAGMILLLPLFAWIGPFQWNVATEWISFEGHTWQSLTAFGNEQVWTQIVILFWNGGGILMLALIPAFFLLAWVARRNRRDRWLLAMIFFPFAWLCASLWNGSNPTMPFLLTLPALSLWSIEKILLLTDGQGWFLRKITSYALVMAASVSAWNFACSPALQAEPAWGAIGERVERVARIYQPVGEAPLFLIANTSETTSGLGFFLLQREPGEQREFPPVFLKESQNLANQFGLWPRYDEFLEKNQQMPPSGDSDFQEIQGYNPYIGRNALYIGEESPEDLPQVISNGFVRVQPLEKIKDPSGRSFYLYLCEDYQTAPL